MPDPAHAARRSLRADAAYCAGAGLIALALSGPLARWFHIDPLVVAGLGAATLVWAWLLTRLARRIGWREPLRLVAAVNALATIALGVVAALAPGAGSRLLLAAVALEVAAFAVVQLATLLRS